LPKLDECQVGLPNCWSCSAVHLPKSIPFSLWVENFGSCYSSFSKTD
jgi:hypothetical protein